MSSADYNPSRSSEGALGDPDRESDVTAHNEGNRSERQAAPDTNVLDPMGLPGGTCLAHRFEIDALVSVDPIGARYRARDLEEDSECFLVVVRPLHLWGEDRFERIRRRIGVVASLDHPTVPLTSGPFHDEERGLTFWTARPAEGIPLAEWQAANPKLPADAVQQIAEDLLSGLGVLHRRMDHGTLSGESIWIIEADDRTGARFMNLPFGTLGKEDEPLPSFEERKRADLMAVSALLYELTAPRLDTELPLPDASIAPMELADEGQETGSESSPDRAARDPDPVQRPPDESSGTALWKWLAGLEAVLILLLIGTILMNGNPDSHPTEETRSAETPTTTPSSDDPEPTEEADPGVGWHDERLPEGMRRSETEGEYVWEADGAIMVYVPGGTLAMGNERGNPDERPVHDVRLRGFYMDRDEVTWERWRRVGMDDPPAPRWGIRPDHPVVNLSWSEARAYCLHTDKRLPTEAQWEWAARGPEGHLLPWGDEEATPERANFGTKKTVPASALPAGASWCGVRNMAGNVAEWCRDVYDDAFYLTSPKQDPVNQGRGKLRVIRGGSYYNSRPFLISTVRERGGTGSRTDSVGFRTIVPGVE